MLIKGKVLDDSTAKHILFAVNTEGINSKGFAGEVARRFWTELENIGPQPLGTVIKKQIGKRTFYACVIYSLGTNERDYETGEDGQDWDGCDVYLEKCLAQIEEENLCSVYMAGSEENLHWESDNTTKLMKVMRDDPRDIKIYVG